MKYNLSFAMIAVFLGFSAGAQTYDWGKAYGGIGEDVVRAMHADAEGNVYTTGYFTDNADYDPGEGVSEIVSNGFFDVFVQKLNTDGDLEWVISFGDFMFDYGTGLDVDSEGNVYVTGVYQETVDFDPGEGVFELTSNGGEDVFVLKLTSNGEFVWARGMGSPFYEEPTSVGVDDAGNVYVSGYFSEQGDYNPGDETFTLTSNGGQDLFIVKLNVDGNFAWAFNIGGPQQELALGMDVSSDGNVYITGFFNDTVDFDPGAGVDQRTAPGGSQGYVLNLDSNGEYVYATVFGGAGNVTAYDVSVNSGGEVFAAGSFTNDVAIGGIDFISEGFEDALVVKLNASGDITWARTLAGEGFQNAYDVSADPFGNVVLAGYFEGTADFDPSDEGVFQLTKNSAEPFDAFYCMLDGAGIFVNAGQFGGTNFLEHHGVSTDSNGNIYLASAFQGSVDLDPTPNSEETVSAVDFRDNYVIKLLADPSVGTNDLQSLPALSVYPNPATDHIQVVLPGSKYGVTFAIFDQSGRRLKQGLLGFETNQISLNGITSGVYILRVNGYQPVKWIRQ